MNEFLQRCLAHSWPHLVLFAVYVGYLMAGGGIFLVLEGGQGPDYANQIVEYNALKEILDSAIANLSQGLPLSTATNLTELWEQYTALVGSSYLANLEYSARVEWTFTGSVLFCATTIATIGYGDTVPTTTEGRVIIVIYSLIGIPLTLTFLTDIGGLLARFVIWVAGKLRCRKSNGTIAATKTRGDVKSVVCTVVGDLQQNQEGCTVSETEERLHPEMRLTLGIFQDTSRRPDSMGNISRRSSAAEEANDAAALTMDATDKILVHGHTNLSYVEVPPPSYEDQVKRDNSGERYDGKGERYDGKGEQTKPSNGPMTNRETGEVSEVDKGESIRDHVPVAVVVCILLVYTLLGALMIGYVESWDYGEALYFTFITLTTIGFGDFVPMQHFRDIPSFFGCLAYTIFGLSVMSMCIALVQQKVVMTMSKVAGKIGFS